MPVVNLNSGLVQLNFIASADSSAGGGCRFTAAVEAVKTGCVPPSKKILFSSFSQLTSRKVASTKEVNAVMIRFIMIAVL
jgi:hypothetical protein